MRDHVAAPPGPRLPVAAVRSRDRINSDVYRAAVKWGADLRVGAHSRGGAPRLPRDVERPARTGANRAAGPRCCMPRATTRPCGCHGRRAYRPRNRPKRSDAQIDAVAELLSNAARPLVIAGAGVGRRLRQRGAARRRRATRIVRVITSMAGRAVVPTDHPNAVYGLGAGGDVAKRRGGTSCSWWDHASEISICPSTSTGDRRDLQRVIQIDVDPRHIGVTRPLALGVVADAGTALARARRARSRRESLTSQGHELPRALPCRGRHVVE